MWEGGGTGEKGWNLLFFFQAEDGIRDDLVTGVQTCALPILFTIGSMRVTNANDFEH